MKPYQPSPDALEVSTLCVVLEYDGYSVTASLDGKVLETTCGWRTRGAAYDYGAKAIAAAVDARRGNT